MLIATLLQLQLGTGAVTDPILINLTNSPIFLGFFKILFIIGAVLYVIFSFVVIRQIAIMRQTVMTAFSQVIQLIGYIHFIIAIAVLLLFIIML